MPGQAQRFDRCSPGAGGIAVRHHVNRNAGLLFALVRHRRANFADEPPLELWARLQRSSADDKSVRIESIHHFIEEQAKCMGLFFDEMVDSFDPDAFIVGGGALEASPEFQGRFISEISAAMPNQREEQADPIHVMPNGDTAGARGAAIEALSLAQQSGLA